MKKTMLVGMVAVLAATSAFADGFVCQARNGSLTVKAYNHTSANQGTRTAAILVLSDPSASAGERTIATFTDVEGTLTSKEVRYVGNVDLRFKNQSNKEALIAGQVALREINTVALTVDFSYANPVQAGDTVTGSIDLNLRDGSQMSLNANCERYLKN